MNVNLQCYSISLYSYQFILISVQRHPVDIKNRPRIPIPDEDPYSIAGNGAGSGGSSGSSGGFGINGNGIINTNGGHVATTREQLLMQAQQLAQRRSEKPPKLPPRDNQYAHESPYSQEIHMSHEIPKVLKVLIKLLTF